MSKFQILKWRIQYDAKFVIKLIVLILFNIINYIK